MPPRLASGFATVIETNGFQPLAGVNDDSTMAPRLASPYVVHTSACRCHIPRTDT